MSENEFRRDFFTCRINAIGFVDHQTPQRAAAQKRIVIFLILPLTVFGVEQNRNGGIDDGKIFRLRPARFSAPERIENTLSIDGIRVFLLMSAIHNRPETVAVAERILSRRFNRTANPEPLQIVLGILKTVPPFLVEPGGREIVKAHFPRHARHPHPGVIALHAGISLDGYIAVFMADERAAVEASALPHRHRPRRVVGSVGAMTAEIRTAVLLNNQPIRIVTVHPIEKRLTAVRSERTFVAARINGK